MSVRLAVVGSGYMAAEYIRAAKNVINLEIVGICSRNLDTARTLATKFHIPFVSDDLQELLLSCRPDVFLVCVPELSTEQVLIQLFEFGIPIIAEKPVGLSVNQAKLIEAKALEAKCQLYVALNRRFFSSTEQVSEQIEPLDGKRFIRVIDQENQLAARDSGQPKLVVDNWMFANSIHIIDLMRFFARGNVSYIDNRTVDITKHGWIHISQISFSSGDVALYTCFWNLPAKWSVDISIGEYSWQLSPLEQARYLSLHSREFQMFDVHQSDLELKPGLLRILEEIKSLVEDGKTGLTPINTANLTMELIEGIYNVK